MQLPAGTAGAPGFGQHTLSWAVGGNISPFICVEIGGYESVQVAWNHRGSRAMPGSIDHGQGSCGGREAGTRRRSADAATAGGPRDGAPGSFRRTNLED